MNEDPTPETAMISVQFKESRWPTSLPHPEEEFFFSVVCGNTHLHWAMHHNFQKHYSPATCWTTRVDTMGQGLPEPDRLIPFLPKVAIDLFWPDEDSVPASRQALCEYMNSKRIPFVTVYLVSTNPANEEKLAFLFEGLYCRLIRLKATDFYNPLPYNTIGIDRLANGKGVASRYSRPTMVIDGGTAMTITFLDQQGRILNGAITLGLGAKFRELHEATGKLPHITPEEMKLAWENRVSDKNNGDGDAMDDGAEDGRPRPLTAFAENTREAIMAGVVMEVALFLNGMARTWIDQLAENTERRNNKGDKDGEEELPKPLIVATGSDGPILADLLSPNRCQHIINMNQKFIVDVEVKRIRFLAHHGIAEVLLDEKKKLETELEHTDNGVDNQNLRNELIGQRVAKVFNGSTNKSTGDSTFYGVIVAVQSGRNIFDENVFTIDYDDGDSEEMEILEVYKALQLYTAKGEPGCSPFNTRPKLEGARQGAKLLATFSELIKSSKKEDGIPPRKRMRHSTAAQVPDDTSQENDDGKPAARRDDEMPADDASNGEPGAAFRDETAGDVAGSIARNISDDDDEANSAIPNVSGNAANGEGAAGDMTDVVDAGNGEKGEGIAGDITEVADTANGANGEDLAGDPAGDDNEANGEDITGDEETDAGNGANREGIAGDEIEETNAEGAAADPDADPDADAAAAARDIARDKTGGADTGTGNELDGEGAAGGKAGGADADAAAGGAIEDFVGWRVAKDFEAGVFCGTITEKRADDLWFVEYDDGDSEEFEMDEVLRYNKHYSELRTQHNID